MLGPGIIGASTPFAFGYALFARTRVSNRWLSHTALAISAIELLVVASFIIAAVWQAASR
jgi:hypothetical protein